MKILLFIYFFYLINFNFSEELEHINYICDNIYLGDSIAAKDEDLLKQYNISFVVNCANSCTSKYKDLKFLELKLYDSAYDSLFPKIEVAYKFIKENSKNSNNNIFIHCLQGKSRSPSVVIFYLMNEKGWDYDTCIKFLKEKRPSISPNTGYEKQLREYYDEYIKNKI